MYDFSLVLMIAQHAQKDPREYLPFLRELRALSKFYQRFRIDDHLKRHVKALRNLGLAGADHFEEAMSYVEQHQLYEEALSIWRNTDSYKAVLNVYGNWLFDRREFKQAALVFVEAEKPSKVMVAYEKSLEWQELFDLALRENRSEEDVIVMGYRVAGIFACLVTFGWTRLKSLLSEDLSSKKRYSEAARVLLDYSKDVRQAVIALVQGHNISEARRVVSIIARHMHLFCSLCRVLRRLCLHYLPS
jgi:elongator complex protein 1